MISSFIKRLLFVRQFSIIDGKIDLLGSREVMIPSSFIFKIQESNKDIYNMIKSSIYEDMKKISSKIGSSDEGLVKGMKEIYETYGLGTMEILNLDNKKKEASISITDSVIAREFLKNNHSSKEVKCHLIAGCLAGMFSFLFKINVECIESKCLCSKDSSCYFEVKA